MSSHETRTVRIARIEPAARDQSILVLERDSALEALHTRSGQYCRIGFIDTDLEGHFALIDPPGLGSWRFLLRAGGPVADLLRQLAPGTTITIRGPLGHGFPIERATDKDALLLSAGAGIAAIRPLLLTLMEHGHRHIWLYHGTRTLDQVPFAHDLDRARMHGAHVTVAISSSSDAEGIPRRIQNALQRDNNDFSRAVAFVSGMDAMVEAMRSILPNYGLPIERIFLNY